MSTDSVETRVVQIQFDNQKFQKNIAKTQKSLEKLNKDMEFKGSKKELKELQKSIDAVNTDNLSKGFEGAGEAVTKFTVGLKEIIKYKVVGRVIDKMTDSAVKFMRTMSGIDNIRAGWAAYEEQITTIGGVVNNVLSKYDGDRTAALEDVTEAMEKLQWYADETSFSFQTMSNGIRQFTTSGLGVEAATQASMGVTALAGMSKEFDPNKISSAMNAVAKAFQTGNMNLMQWNTLTQTAGIVSEDFSAKLLEEAVAQGKLIKSSGGQYRTKKKGTLVTTENIADSLSEDWLTKDILSNVMGEYSAASVAADKIISGYQEDTLDETVKNMIDKIMEEENWSELTASHMIEIMENEEYAKTLNELGYSFSKLSVQAFKSSQQATSATQAIQSVGIAIQAQFQHIFSSIWGNADESTEVWTKLANDLNTIIVSPFYTLSDIFSEWSRLTKGGSADFREAFGDLLDFAITIRDIFNEVWNDVFGDSLENGVSILQKLTIKLKEFTKWLKTNETVQKAFKTVFTAVLNGIKIAGKIISSLFKLVKSFWPVVKVIIGAFGQLVKWLAEGIAKFAEWVNESKIAEKIANNLAGALRLIQKFLIKISDWFGSKWKKIKEAWENNGTAKKITQFFEKLKTLFSESGFSNNLEESMTSFKDVMISFWNTMKTVFPKLEEWYNKFVNSKFWQTVKPILTAIWETVKTLFWSIVDTVVDFANAFKEDPTKKLWDLAKAIAGIVGVLLLIRTLAGLGSVFKNLSWMLDSIRLYFKAKTFTMWVLIIAALAGSIWLLVDAIKKLTEVEDTGKLWSSAGVIMTLMAVISGIMIGLLAMSKHVGANDYKIYKTISAMQRICFGLAILFVAVAETSDKLAKLSWPDFLKIPVFLMVTAASLAAVAYCSRVTRRVKVASIFKFATMVSAIFAMIKIALWSADKIKDVDVYSLVKTLGLMSMVVGVVYVAALALKELTNKLSVSNVVNAMMPMFVILGAFAGFAELMARTKDINTYELMARTKIMIEAFKTIMLLGAGIVALQSGLNLLSLIKPEIIRKPISNMTGAIISMGIGLLAMIGALKVAEKLDPDKAWSSFGKVAAIFGAISAFVIILNLVSKKVEGGISGAGASFNGYKNSPIFGTIMGISVLLFALIGCMYLMENISWASFLNNFGKLAIVMLTIGGICTAIGWSMKGVDRKAFANFKWTLLAMAGLIFALLTLADYMNQTDEEGNLIHPAESLKSAIKILIGIMLMLVVAAKIAESSKSTGGLGSLIAMIVGLTLIMAAIIVYGKVVQQVHWSVMLMGVLMMGVVLAGLILLVKMLAKSAGTTSIKDIVVLSIITLLIAGIISVLTVLVTATKDIKPVHLLSITALLVAVFGIAALMILIASVVGGAAVPTLIGLGIMTLAFGILIGIFWAIGYIAQNYGDDMVRFLEGTLFAAVKAIIDIVELLEDIDNPIGLISAALALKKALKSLAVGIAYIGVASIISSGVDLEQLTEDIGKLSRMLSSIDPSAIASAGEALGDALSDISVGMSRIHGNWFENALTFVWELFGAERDTTREESFEMLRRFLETAGNVNPASISSVMSFMNQFPSFVNSLANVNFVGIGLFTRALDDVIEKVRILREEFNNDFVIKLRLDDESLSVLSNFRINNSSALGIQGSFSGGRASVSGNIDNSSITVNVNNNNTYTDALAYSYDEQRQRAVAYEQAAKIIST